MPYHARKTWLLRAKAMMLMLVTVSPASADALVREGVQLNTWNGNDYHFPFDGADGHADFLEVTAALEVRPGLLATIGATRIQSNLRYGLGSGDIEDTRFAAGAAWQVEPHRSVTAALAMDLMVVNFDALVPDPTFSGACIGVPTCPPRISYTETEIGAEISGGAMLHPLRSFSVVAQAGYQQVGDEAGAVLEGGLLFRPDPEVELRLLFFDEPRINGFKAGISYRFSKH